jgi:hypothetical protein
LFRSLHDRNGLHSSLTVALSRSFDLPFTKLDSPLFIFLTRQDHCAKHQPIHTNVETYIYPYTHLHTHLLDSFKPTRHIHTQTHTHTHTHTQSHHVQPHYHFSWCCCSSPSYYTHLRTMLWLPQMEHCCWHLVLCSLPSLLHLPSSSLSEK